MDDDYEPTPEEMKLMKVISERAEREIDEFFVFPDGDWFPQPSIVFYRILLQKLFTYFRHRWPNDFEPCMLRQWVNTAKEFYYADPTNPDAGNIDRSTFPLDLHPLDTVPIYELARVEYGAGLPKILALEFMAGGTAARGARFSDGGASKKGKEYEPKRSIRTICEKLDSYEFNKVIAFLRNADECADFYESTTAPIDVQIDSVEDGKEVIRYRRRGIPPSNKPQTLTFGRLRNILTEIKPK
jgi:hypothetical protein